MRNDTMTKEKKDEISLAKARDFKDGSTAPFLAQMEWEEHLINVQQKLNRRTVLLSIFLSAALGIAGTVIGVISTRMIDRLQTPPTIENIQIKPPTATTYPSLSTTNKTFSSKSQEVKNK